MKKEREKKKFFFIQKIKAEKQLAEEFLIM